MNKDLTSLFKRVYPLFLMGLGLYCFVLIFSQMRQGVNEHFSQLAASFLQGKTYFIHESRNAWLDTVYHNSRHYWPLGPFPAVLLMPFVGLFSIFNQVFFQGYASAILGIEIFILVFFMAKKQGFDQLESFLWAMAFCFGSALFGALFIPWSYFFAHTVATTLLCLFIWEYFYGQRNWVRLGIYAGALLTTRIPAGISAFAWLVLSSVQISRNPFVRIYSKKLGWVLGLVIAVILLGEYNYIRFGNPMESGYNWQIVYTPAHVKARSYGSFNILHIPGNLYASLLSIPMPVYRDNESSVLKYPFIASNPWGMSIFFTSPYLLAFLFSATITERKFVNILVPILSGLIIIYTYYGIGYYQYGYRYFLDVFPWVFILLMQLVWKKWEKIPPVIHFLILSGIGINTYLLSTLRM